MENFDAWDIVLSTDQAKRVLTQSYAEQYAGEAKSATEYTLGRFLTEEEYTTMVATAKINWETLAIMFNVPTRNIPQEVSPSSPVVMTMVCFPIRP